MPNALTLAESQEETALVNELAEALANNPMMPADVVSIVAEPIAVSVDFKRSAGRCSMIVQASGFHAYLDRIGVPFDDYAMMYKDAPADRDGNRSRPISPRSNTISPFALLRKSPDGSITFDIGQYYSSPPLAAALNQIGDSIEECIDLIVDHYRPVEISVRVHTKAAKKEGK